MSTLWSSIRTPTYLCYNFNAAADGDWFVTKPQNGIKILSKFHAHALWRSSLQGLAGLVTRLSLFFRAQLEYLRVTLDTNRHLCMGPLKSCFCVNALPPTSLFTRNVSTTNAGGNIKSLCGRSNRNRHDRMWAIRSRLFRVLRKIHYVESFGLTYWWKEKLLSTGSLSTFQLWLRLMIWIHDYNFNTCQGTVFMYSVSCKGIQETNQQEKLWRYDIFASDLFAGSH
jgi:hypothetical protein